MYSLYHEEQNTFWKTDQETTLPAGRAHGTSGPRGAAALMRAAGLVLEAAPSLLSRAGRSGGALLTGAHSVSTCSKRCHLAVSGNCYQAALQALGHTC